MPWETEAEKEEHGSETRLVILAYATGFFIFEILEPTKELWAEGETVKIHYRYCNTGDGAAACTMRIYDNATGELLQEIVTARVDPMLCGECKACEIFDERTGEYFKMPDHDVTLRFELSP